TGAKVEILLTKELEPGLWEALAKPGKRARIGEQLFFDCGLSALISSRTPKGGRVLKFDSKDIDSYLEESGQIPLPPYIKKELSNAGGYQTVYAQNKGAVAAPTAGFHFTPCLLQEIIEKGIKIARITLHCGPATFRPVKSQDIREHSMETEWIKIDDEAAGIINNAKAQGNRIIAVGTTCVRALETASCISGDLAQIKSYEGETSIYITPGYSFKIVNAIITNFHTPCSSNLILVSAFCGMQLYKMSYNYAISNKFRFFSFGDAMFIS
ncbi:MAG: tRNA preQ1(34) S-adenosylmethionine ribosyltransferase-isomerase QueA, partial [Candidatus Omnitrophota bacterium]